MWNRVVSRACVPAVRCSAFSSSVHAQVDATILWLAAGAHGAPCMAPNACASAYRLACVREQCVEAGADGEDCRSPEYPNKTRCDSGLACDNGMCAPAGGKGQARRSCESASSAFCQLDRCATSFSCDPTSFACEPAGGRNQPCRELELIHTSMPQCDDELVCTMGICVEEVDEGLECQRDLSCPIGLFCEQTGSGGYGICSIQPRGLVSNAMTRQAT